MLSSFPEPYPDELLYSVIARYHIRSGNTAAKVTLKELFDNNKVTAVYDLPSNIDKLISRLPFGFKWLAEDLIYNNTLFPFYTAFLPSKRVDQIMASMKGEYGGDIHSRGGIMASSIVTPEYFRFCPYCRQEDIKNYGEAYWHRLHQIPGIYVCPTHKVFLQNSNIKTHNKHEFITADTEDYDLKNSLNMSVCKGKVFDLLCDFSKEVTWLFQNSQKLQAIKDIRACYIDVLKSNGLATPQERVFQRELKKRVIDYYDYDFLKLMQSNLNEEQDYDWLTCIVRTHRKSFHPIRHLLLIKFLATTLDSFINNATSFKPFGDGPWLCLNAAAEHFRNPVIKDVIISYCADTKLPVGTFKCYCGFVYTRRGPDKFEADQDRIGRIKSFGAIWEDKLLDYMGEGLTINAIAKRLRVDPKTVKKYAAKVDGAINPSVVVYKSQNYKESYRSQWIKVHQEFPDYTKTELRKILPGTYIWLYRNDKEWMDSCSYSYKIRHYKNARINWEERDSRIYALVVNSVEYLSNPNDKPIRITISRLGKEINCLTLLQRHLDKLPTTREYIMNHIESVEAFQKRRIEWIIKKMVSNNQDLIKWKILKQAGIKNGQLIKSDEIINNAVTNLEV